jgi:hypothetical protein
MQPRPPKPLANCSRKGREYENPDRSARAADPIPLQFARARSSSRLRLGPLCNRHGRTILPRPGTRRAGSLTRTRSAALRAAFFVPRTTPASRFESSSRVPLTVTVGGVQADVTFAGNPWLVGVTQVNFTVAPSVTSGPQPVVVTQGGVSSPAATLIVQ